MKIAKQHNGYRTHGQLEKYAQLLRRKKNSELGMFACLPPSLSNSFTDLHPSRRITVALVQQRGADRV